MIRKIVTGTVLVVVGGTALAQGAFEFDDIPGQEPAFEVNVNAMMLGFLRTAIAPTDPAGAEMLSGLRSIKLRVYTSVDDTRRFSSFIDDVTEQLEDEDWSTVVSGQQEGANVSVHMKMNADEVQGMTFMVNDGSEAFFMNIDGTLTAEDLGRIMALPPVQAAIGEMGLPMMAPAAPRPDGEAP